MTNEIKKLFELLTKKEKSGSDYTAKVTRINGNKAYVQFDGSDITDTPVSLSIGAKEGDKVRVRVADGRAWMVGNDSAPPNDSSEVKKEINAINAHIEKIETENIIGENGWINLKDGTFSYGGGRLAWNGKLLSVNGNIKSANADIAGKVAATSGEIGGWDISSDGFVKSSVGAYIYRTGLGYRSGSGSSSYGVSVAPELMAVWYGANNLFSATDSSEIRPTSIYTTGTISEGGVLLSNKYAPKSGSDPVLKKNIKKSVLNALDLIKRIPLHAFDWKKNGKHWDVGFVAPELYEIDKNLAEPPTGENGSYWSVDSFYLVGVLTKAVQELTDRVETLERELNERKNHE